MMMIGNGYKPSTLIDKWHADGDLNECDGLSEIVRDAIALGYRAFIDLGDGETYLEEVTPENVVRAVHEVDDAVISFVPTQAEVRGGNLRIIAGNGEDWLVDYSAVQWLDRLVQKYAV